MKNVFTSAIPAVLCGGLAFGQPGTSAAQSFPAKPIRTVVPFAPGSILEVGARITCSAPRSAAPSS